MKTLTPTPSNRSSTAASSAATTTATTTATSAATSALPAGPVQVYGIPNCDTVKKARTWLSEQGLDYEFHDFKKQGVPPDALAQWVSLLGWEVLLNRKGTTWRQLDAATQDSVQDATSAQAVMRAHASVIKRPVVVWPSPLGHPKVTVGFAAQLWGEFASRK